MIFHKTPRYKRKIRLVGTSHVITIPKPVIDEHLRTTKNSSIPTSATIEYNDFLEQATIRFDQ